MYPVVAMGLAAGIGFYWIIYIIFIVFIVSKIKKSKGNNRGNRTIPDKSYYNNVPANNNVKANSAGVKPVRASAASSVSKGTSASESAMRDNTSNDWLAKQLREEKYAMSRVSDMFQLKQEHVNKCEAEFIKRFHESNCDEYEVDDGTRK